MYLNYLMHLDFMGQVSQKIIKLPGEEGLKFTSVEPHQSTRKRTESGLSKRGHKVLQTVELLQPIFPSCA